MSDFHEVAIGHIRHNTSNLEYKTGDKCTSWIMPKLPPNYSWVRAGSGGSDFPDYTLRYRDPSLAKKKKEKTENAGKDGGGGDKSGANKGGGRRKKRRTHKKRRTRKKRRKTRRKRRRKRRRTR